MKTRLFISIVLLLFSYFIKAQEYEKVFLGSDTSEFYFKIVPDFQAKGLLVLLPGARGNSEWPLKTTKIPYIAAERGLVTIMISYEPWLVWLRNDVLELVNKAINDVLNKHNIPANKCIIGGFSAGGNMALNYTEHAFIDSSITAITPCGVFALDPPMDLVELYKILNYEMEGCYCLDKKVKITEETKSLHEQMTKYLGTPWNNHNNYFQYSPFLISDRFENGGMAIHLKDVPVRIYSGFDWDYYKNKTEYCSLTIPSSPFLISFLQSKGNERATYKDQFEEDYYPDGGEEFRGRHAWKGFDSEECVDWIIETLNED